MISNFNEYFNRDTAGRDREAQVSMNQMPAVPYDVGQTQVFEAPPISDMSSYFRNNNFSYMDQDAPYISSAASPAAAAQGQMSYEPAQSILYSTNNMPETITNPIYTPSFLSSQIGKPISVEFLCGSQLVKKEGHLTAVGVSYIVLGLKEPASKIMCDIDSIKFVTITDEDDKTETADQP